MKCLLTFLISLTISSSIHANEVWPPARAMEPCESYLTYLKTQFPQTIDALRAFEGAELKFRRAEDSLSSRPMTELERQAFLIPPGASYDVNSLTLRVKASGATTATITVRRDGEILGRREVDFSQAHYAMISLDKVAAYLEKINGRKVSKDELQYLMNIDLRSIVTIGDIGRHRLVFLFRFYPIGNRLMASARFELALMRDAFETEARLQPEHCTVVMLDENLQCLTPIATIASEEYLDF